METDGHANFQAPVSGFRLLQVVKITCTCRGLRAHHFDSSLVKNGGPVKKLRSGEDDELH